VERNYHSTALEGGHAKASGICFIKTSRIPEAAKKVKNKGGE